MGTKQKLRKVLENLCGHLDRTTYIDLIKYKRYKRPNSQG